MDPEKIESSPLLVRLSLESAIAIFSAATIAPAVSIVDKAIVSNASGVEPLVPCLLNGLKSLFTTPIHFLKQPAFLLIWGVYSGTYIVGNCTDAVCERSGRNSFYPKFIASSSANVTLSVLKDKAYARMFGKGPARPLPFLSYVLFATRDSATIFASFSLPKPASLYLQKHIEIEATHADTLCQLLTPITMQIFSTPLHLHGLDIYNRGDKAISVTDRIDFIKQEYVKTLMARMARIFPAFGIGGVINTHMRKLGKSFLVATYN